MSATNRNKTIRIGSDNYPTPHYTIKPLIEKISDWNKVNSFLEPCKGDGRILDYIPDNIKKIWCEIREDRNYFDFKIKNIDLIITNPPFTESLEFLKKSLTEAKTVCYLQRLNWLGSKKRKDFWNNNTPDYLFPLSQRPQFRKELGLEGGSDATDYAWFIWDGLGIFTGKHIQVI